jgi:cytoskeletal protein CcmA (bactofilin family)
MMFKNASPQGDLNGFLDAGSHITGELSFDDTFRIDGKLTGNVVSKGNLIVGERGEVDGEIRVGRVFISGVVRGTMKISERAEITATGKVFADLFTPALMIEEGAFFEGRCSMERKEVPAQAGRSPKIAQMPMAK